MSASEAGTAPGVSVGPTSEFSLFFHVTPGLNPNMCFMNELTVASVGSDGSAAGFAAAGFAGDALAAAGGLARSLPTDRHQ